MIKDLAQREKVAKGASNAGTRRFPRSRHALPVWWFPAIDTADVGPAEVASQPVHHVVVGETAAEVRDDGLNALSEAPGVGVERGKALHRGLRLCGERGAVDADGTAARL